MEPQVAPIWSPDKATRQQKSNIKKLAEEVSSDYDVSDYDKFHAFSIAQGTKNVFWKKLLDFSGLVYEGDPTRAVDNASGFFPPPKWFPDLRINFAENVLGRGFNDDDLAMIGISEGEEEATYVTYGSLKERCGRWYGALEQVISAGDRVAAYVPNCVQAVEALLAVAALGGVWTSASPDFGSTAVIDRFSQVQPKLLISCDAVFYSGKVHSNEDKLRIISSRLPSVEKVVIFPFLSEEYQFDIKTIPRAIASQEFFSGHDNCEIQYTRTSFDHPLYIMYSSGTTGAPKCIVHGVGGTLITHAKEHLLHVDLTPQQRMMFFTTTGWMMWNWLVSCLVFNVTAVLYNGASLTKASPAHLFDIVQKYQVNVLGVSPKYLAVLEGSGSKPVESHDLSCLRTILSTGSPLSPHLFEFVYSSIKPDVWLASITGGTDILGCFMMGHPDKPVYPGELQCFTLGMAIECWDEDGKPIVGQRGELVCVSSFPSMPVFFWGDVDQEKYRKAYFTTYGSHVWHHGDYCLLNPHTGGVVMLGRSDAVLNPDGVRIGTSEIYSVLERMPEIADSVCVPQRNASNQERTVLFVKMADSLQLTDHLRKRIASAIRSNLSPKHVPSVILPIADIPHTVSGKKVEVAVRLVLAGQPVPSESSLANPDSLALFRDVPELRGGW